MNPEFLNCFMPAEWSAHQCSFVSWPVRDSMCYPDDYDVVCGWFESLINAIAEFEPVTVIINPEDHLRIKKAFNNERISFLPVEHNDSWIRDNGPTFVIDENGELSGINWRFNAWGEKYVPWNLDNDVAPKILDYLRLKRFDAPLVMEGGSIHVDGEGTLLTTEECLLNPNRNPCLGKSRIEDYLKKYLGIKKIIWLKKGLSGDETDGHVDNIACFAAPGKILLQVCDSPGDENYEITRENLSILENETDAIGRKIEVISIQQPPRTIVNGKRLTLSYLNFYFVNGGIILPVFGGNAKDADRNAEMILMKTFPERRIRKVDGMAIIKEGGNVHCTTQQMPVPGRVK